MSQSVKLTVDGCIATLQLNRPDCLNAMDIEMLQSLLEKLKEVGNLDAPILIITGNEKVFSSGGDLQALLQDTDEDSFDRAMNIINEMTMTLYTLPKLVISAISGPAEGLGFSFALAADYVIADKSARLCMNYINIGLIPDGGGHFFLKQRIGERRAKEVIWEGKIYQPEEALNIGFINEVTEEQAYSRAKAKADEWLKKPIGAMIKTKKIMADSSRQHLLEILRMEKLGQIKMRESLDHKEGLQAILEKRTLEYSGN
ncbi:enoyl-CoA hydratase [Calidifontibacillus erzurumensis]|uniref:enoyl-CoA hydratase n=1 Tax=Calidifontibacillus erzurumensis TaxID=2741433 RepID=UPI0035B549A4